MASESKCFFCKTACRMEEIPSLSYTGKYWCRSCGEYLLDSHDKESLSSEAEKRFKIACVLHERRLRKLCGVALSDKTDPEDPVSGYPQVSIAEILGQYPRTASDMIDRTLLNMDRLVHHPFSQCSIEGSDLPSITFTQSSDDALRMLKTLSDLDYVTHTIPANATGVSSGKRQYGVKPKGWKRIAELQTSNINSKQAFAAMWFDEYTKSIWEDGLFKGISDAGYSPLKIDSKEHNNKICDEIIVEIRRSKFVVADFTGNRGGVYYEAGFAKGLGIPVIWTIEEEWLKKNKEELHFDTRQYNHIMYKDPADLRDRLKNRILATII